MHYGILSIFKYLNMKEGFVIDDVNSLSVNALRDMALQDSTILSIRWNLENSDAVHNLMAQYPGRFHVRGPICEDFVKFCLANSPKGITVEGSGKFRLEYSFGLDVLKFKPQLRDFFSHFQDIDYLAVETDFRHENILHAGDCGAGVVEICVSDYLKDREHYIDGIEVASMRDMQVAVMGDTKPFLNDLGRLNIGYEFHNL